MLQLNSANQHIGKARRQPSIDTYFAGKPKPTQYQGTAVAAVEAGTDGTTNVQCRSIDCDNINMRTTVMKLPTDCVKLTEPTLTRVSPVVAKMAHTDGTRVMQYQSDDQNSLKTTNMQMPMDYLEIPNRRCRGGSWN